MTPLIFKKDNQIKRKDSESKAIVCLSS